MELFSSLLCNAGTVEPQKLEQEYSNILIENETVYIGFKLIIDSFIFTNKHLILVDKKGITVNKTEYSYKLITRFRYKYKQSQNLRQFKKKEI